MKPKDFVRNLTDKNNERICSFKELKKNQEYEDDDYE